MVTRCAKGYLWLFSLFVFWSKVEDEDDTESGDQGEEEEEDGKEEGED